jgi:hypothetical protein
VSVPLEIPVIQVAGIRDRAEAMLLQECGIRYLGFPLRLPVNRADLTETRRRTSSVRSSLRRAGCLSPT